MDYRVAGKCPNCEGQGGEVLLQKLNAFGMLYDGRSLHLITLPRLNFRVNRRRLLMQRSLMDLYGSPFRKGLGKLLSRGLKESPDRSS